MTLISSQVFLENLKKELEKLSTRRHCLFATVVCEKHQSDYIRFVDETGWGDAAALSLAIEAGRKANNGMPPRSKEELQALRARCLAASPDTEDFTSPLCSDALDAMVMAIHLLDILIDNDRQATGWIASLAIDCADRKAQEGLGDFHLLTPEVEEKIASSDVFNAELVFL